MYVPIWLLIVGAVMLVAIGESSCDHKPEIDELQDRIDELEDQCGSQNYGDVE